ncbi:maleylpyruvate isomerase family mycothiol-dependent enzyme [Agrococcus sp. SL85]|uniref:maleylpyruvate isomerase family mycothiol-dependent enzyme n=1 Tax=Agrococcus sp. SL85 TaxID=2995141 RepID=UPI00226C9533|nr:maleylpyruvate isomerase family mycothiol-dependent enzyme [Agrococcus sp. SL85]WAC65591.1 maleylpyruvate isomerase family mycothiol-dependent enzyme [Agrococcus sp. SL85]
MPRRTDLHPSELWDAVHVERRALIADLQRIEDTDWDAPSGCAGWSVHDVAAHLVDVWTTTRLGFARRLVAAGLDFDRDNRRGVERERRATPAATLAAMRAAAGRTDTPPAPLASRLVEEIAHGDDIRRPLGIAHPYPLGAVLPALDHQLATPARLGGAKERMGGLRLVATDARLRRGDGSEVRGTALALLLVATGRDVALDELSGPGASLLRGA